MSMIERVARAIADVNGEEYGGRAKALHDVIAKAAIEALRKPTPEMLNAADVEIIADGDTYELSSKKLAEAWGAMIDAALVE